MKDKYVTGLLAAAVGVVAVVGVINHFAPACTHPNNGTRFDPPPPALVAETPTDPDSGLPGATAATPAAATSAGAGSGVGVSS